MLYSTEARRLFSSTSSSSRLHEDVVREIEGVMKGLSLAAVKKSGPSPGVGHKYENLQTIGVVKEGPSPGEGHK
ncbi:hypothetical protein JCGZ_15465 [Jatropha curcas]|uniref:Uncharacterized protein n=1 Tax=Jatropha curcas TaxID=180498 RepID=A0A067LM83_JATCU|nr:hypothetical protein JCGZ_15465 [Jatropha curcas]